MQALQEAPMELWHRGRKVPDITCEEGLAGGVRSLAARYDLQHSEPERLLFPSAAPTPALIIGECASATWRSPIR